MLMANSAAILTDASPASKRGFALGTNQIASLSGQFVGLVAGGLLAAIDWRVVFWVNVPVGMFGTLWAYLRLREIGARHPAAHRLVGQHHLRGGPGRDPGRRHHRHPAVPRPGHGLDESRGGRPSGRRGGCWSPCSHHRAQVVDPLFRLGLFRIRAFAAGNVASFAARLGQGGLQFMLVIWLQGIWLPLHGYSYSSTPLWAGIFLLPLTAGFLLSGPIRAYLSDRYGARGFATPGAWSSTAAASSD